MQHRQRETYPDEASVPLDEAFRIVRHVIDTGLPHGGHGMGCGQVNGTGVGVVHRPDAVSVLASRV
ncbi:hypothetical protein ACWC2T_14040 [Streptomyces sp. NPDC001393]